MCNLYTVQFTEDQVSEIAADSLIWMEQNAELTDKERKCYRVVIRDYLTPDQWEDYIGEEV